MGFVVILKCFKKVDFELHQLRKGRVEPWADLRKISSIKTCLVSLNGVVYAACLFQDWNLVWFWDYILQNVYVQLLKNSAYPKTKTSRPSTRCSRALLMSERVCSTLRIILILELIVEIDYCLESCKLSRKSHCFEMKVFLVECWENFVNFVH